MAAAACAQPVLACDFCSIYLANESRTGTGFYGGVSEQFTLLYPAAFPTVPTKPVPLRVMLLSLASGLAVGVGLTLLREYLDRSVRDVRALRTEFDVPVLGEIARIHPR